MIMNITEELIEIGETLGRQAERLQIARAMLKHKEPHKKVRKFTGLTSKEIARLLQERGRA